MPPRPIGLPMMRWIRYVVAAALLQVSAADTSKCHSKDGSINAAGCGYACDENCNCGRCNTKPGCMSETQCLGNCNGGGNAKWCGGAAPPAPGPTPAPPTPAPPAPAPKPGYPGTCHSRDGSVNTPACGYSCDANCHCGRCNTKPGCMSEDQCLGMCNSGGNAKWCGAAPTPPPPAPPTPPPSPPAKWTTAGNKLQRNGKDVVLHGIGTTCTEYLARGVGMKCWVDYNFATPAALMKINVKQLYPIIDTLRVIASDSVVPVVRIPMTASSWLGVETQASKGNMAKYPNFNVQYQNLIADFVKEYTTYGIVTILDLHWTDDDTENAPMAGKGNTSAVDFWDSVAAKFADNSMVFYELYNEPHRVTLEQWANGDAAHSGMLEMLAAVRKHTDAPAIIAGAGGFAYDSDSLVSLDATLLKQSEKNVIWNFHPYMGPHQAGDNKKCPENFESLVLKVLNATDKPVIITEFGQGCQPTEGAAEQCPGTYEGKTMGYDETILTIAQKHSMSWLPWAWRPMAAGPNTKTCQDVNGGTSPAGLSLAHPTNGQGGDFLDLWKRFAGVTQTGQLVV